MCGALKLSDQSMVGPCGLMSFPLWHTQSALYRSPCAQMRLDGVRTSPSLRLDGSAVRTAAQHRLLRQIARLHAPTAARVHASIAARVYCRVRGRTRAQRVHTRTHTGAECRARRGVATLGADAARGAARGVAHPGGLGEGVEIYKRNIKGYKRIRG